VNDGNVRGHFDNFDQHRASFLFILSGQDEIHSTKASQMKMWNETMKKNTIYNRVLS